MKGSDIIGLVVVLGIAYGGLHLQPSFRSLYVAIPLIWWYVSTFSFSPMVSPWVLTGIIILFWGWILYDLYRSWKFCKTSGIECWVFENLVLCVLAGVAYTVTTYFQGHKHFWLEGIMVAFLSYAAFFTLNVG